MSIKQVAEKAGVSQAAVSYVINGKPGVSEETIAKVNKVINELGYKPRPSNTRPATRLSINPENLGLVIPEGAMSSSLLNTRLFEALYKEIDRRSLKMVSIQLTDNWNLKEIISNSQSYSRLDGLILCSYISSLNNIKPPSIPLVGILGHPNLLERLICDHIEPDNIKIGALAAKYLIDKGHKNIAAINPSVEFHSAIEIRCHNFTLTAESLNAEANVIRIAFNEINSETGNLSVITNDHPVSKWIEKFKNLPNRPTGIFVPSDSHLSILFNAFRQAGLEPGKDVDFIGCNNESMLLQSLSPAPATIDINPNEMARAAIGTLIDRIQFPNNDAPQSHTITYVEPTIVEFTA